MVGRLTVDGRQDPEDHRIAFEAFGVRVAVTTNCPEVRARIPAMIPPGAKAQTEGTADASFGVFVEETGLYRFILRDGSEIPPLNLGDALLLLKNQIRTQVALDAPGVIFIHAGVVAHRGRTIVMPGRPFSGKTTLVLELVRAGATYYSDEYAVINQNGRVLPYPKPLSVRDGEFQGDVEVERFGGVTGDEPLPIGAVVFAQYHPGARWAPVNVSPGRAALALLANTVAAMRRSEEALRTITRAIEGAALLESERGDATEVVGPVLEVAHGAYRAAAVPSH
jgi:hypothetical protein